MNTAEDWRTVYDVWFPPDLEDADPQTHRRMFLWWFGGGAGAALSPLAPILEAANAGRLEPWHTTPLGRLTAIIVLDQFPRGLFAGTPAAYAGDPAALQVAEEGLRNGHYHALTRVWEKLFFVLPLAHAEGPDHWERLQHVVELAETLAVEAPLQLQPLYRFSAGQARGHCEVISRFGRFPHRNAILGRTSRKEERAYLATGDFVHTRQPPDGAAFL